MTISLSLGSLFDGIGGFPLAGVRQGFTPVWASEIEPFPIEVTKIRFPEMLHVGDITKLKGAELAPVDVVCGGSPCQDLSVAGKRAGLQGERSGLFMEQIRVIKELREHYARAKHTDDPVRLRPRYMVWENVPGAFSSADGEDFRAVLEEACRIVDNNVSVPRPPGGVWKHAGAILGAKFSLAWRVYDAQYWSVPQRRKRIYLVADFGGHTAPKILFEQDRLLGDTAPVKEARQGAATCPEAGSGDTGGNQCNRMTDSSPVAFACNQRDEVRDLHDLSGTIQAQQGMKQQTFIAAGFSDGQGEKVSGMDGHPPLAMGNEPDLYENHGIDSRYTGPYEVAPTMSARYGTGGNNVPLITQGLVIPDDNDDDDYYENGYYDEEEDVNDYAETYCIAGNIIDRQDHNGGNGMGFQPNISYTLNTADRHCVFSQQRSDEYVSNDVVSTQSARQYKDATDLICEPTVFGQSQYANNAEGVSFLRAQGGEYRVGSENLDAEPRKLIRRLTPLECERLQGFPDYWTDIPGASDSSRYKALGNSVAIPCVEHVLRGIAFFLQKFYEEMEESECTSILTI